MKRLAILLDHLSLCSVGFYSVENTNQTASVTFCLIPDRNTNSISLIYY